MQEDNAITENEGVAVEATYSCVPDETSRFKDIRVPLYISVKLPTNTYNNPIVEREMVYRCTGCGAYINIYTEYAEKQWTCNICSRENEMHVSLENSPFVSSVYSFLAVEGVVERKYLIAFQLSDVLEVETTLEILVNTVAKMHDTPCRVALAIYGENVYFLRISKHGIAVDTYVGTKTIHIFDAERYFVPIDQMLAEMTAIVQAFGQKMHDGLHGISPESSTAYDVSLVLKWLCYTMHSTNIMMYIFRNKTPAGFSGIEDKKVSERKNTLSLFVFPPTEIGMSDFVQTLRKTTGYLFYYPHPGMSDIERYFGDIDKFFGEEVVYDFVASVRVPPGLAVSEYFDAFLGRSSRAETVRAGLVVAHSSLGISIEPQKAWKTMRKGSHLYVQLTCVWTAKYGEKIVTIVTVRFPYENSLEKIVGGIDARAFARVLLQKQYADSLHPAKALTELIQSSGILMAPGGPVMGLSKPYLYVTEKTVPVVKKFMKFPDTAIQYIPVFVLGLLKSPCLRQATPIDYKEYYNYVFQVHYDTSGIFYPYFVDLTVLLETGCTKDWETLPQLRHTKSAIDPKRIYLLDNYISIFIYCGEDAAPEQIHEIVSVVLPDGGAERELYALKAAFAPAETSAGAVLGAYLEHVDSQRQRTPTTYFVWNGKMQATTDIEMKTYYRLFISYLFEDEFHSMPSYHSFNKTLYKVKTFAPGV